MQRLLKAFGAGRDEARAALAAAERKVGALRGRLKEAKLALKHLGRAAEAQERDLMLLETMTQRLLAECGALPLPPRALRDHVGRGPFAGNFLAQGADSSARVIRLFGTEPPGPVLDWGCGSGRTLTWLRRHPAWRTAWRGCDVDAEAIAWLKSQGIEGAEVCGDDPPLPFSDGMFAGLYCFSVLTHIPPDRHAAWYAEIHRVLRPGGLAYVTVHSDENMRRAKSFTEEERRDYFERGWSWSEREGHYKHAATVTKAYTLDALGGLFEVEAYDPAGYHAMDALTLRKR